MLPIEIGAKGVATLVVGHEHLASSFKDALAARLRDANDGEADGECRAECDPQPFRPA